MSLTPLHRRRGLAALVFCTALLAGLIACGDERQPIDQEPIGGGGDADTEDNGESRFSKVEQAFLASRTQASILFTGALLGKHKPCGCTTPQMGGVERLAALYDWLVKRSGGEVLGLALGWSLAGSGEPQEASKAAFIREVFRTLGFQGILLGDTDLGVSAMTQSYGQGGVLAPTPPLNIILTESSSAHRRNPILDTRIGNLRVRATTLLDPDASDAQGLVGMGLAAQVLDPASGLNQMQPDPEALWIVGARFSSKADFEALRTALKAQGPAIVVNLSGNSFADTKGGTTLHPFEKDLSLFIDLDEKGKEAGVIDLVVDENGKRHVRIQSIRLRPALDARKSPSRKEVKDDLLEMYKQDVREAGYLTDLRTTPRLGEATFVGSVKCATCHKEIYKDWKKTSHSHAMTTLTKINYHWDPECVRCHVIGHHRGRGQAGRPYWSRFEGGFVDPKKTPHLANVGCENCHGAASAHVAYYHKNRNGTAEKAPLAARLFVGLPDTKGEKAWRDTCYTCHDLDNSPAFSADPMKYLKQVNHSRVPSDKRVDR